MEKITFHARIILMTRLQVTFLFLKISSKCSYSRGGEGLQSPIGKYAGSDFSSIMHLLITFVKEDTVYR